MKKIMILMTTLFIFANGEYIRNNTGIVVDTRTGLYWQDNERIHGKSWRDAIEYCENLDLGGLKWRMPNFNEYDSLIDTSRNTPAMSDIFQTTATGKFDLYWTSTTDFSDKNNTRAWTLQTRNGWNFRSYKKIEENGGANTFYIRCVSDGNLKKQ